MRALVHVCDALTPPQGQAEHVQSSCNCADTPLSTAHLLVSWMEASAYHGGICL